MTHPSPATTPVHRKRRILHTRWGAAAAPLGAAILCTALIAEAIKTAIYSRANGDIMEIACPVLGAIFLSIPAAQAWWASIKIMKKSRGK